MLSLKQLNQRGLPKPPWQLKRDKRTKRAYLFCSNTRRQPNKFFMGADTLEHRRFIKQRAEQLNRQWFVTNFCGATIDA